MSYVLFARAAATIIITMSKKNSLLYLMDTF